MVSSLRIALLGLGITTLLSTSRAQEPALVPVPAPDSDVKTELKLGNPMIKGTGPYTVVIKGTLSIDKDSTGFVGTKAKVKGTVFTYDASVGLPKGNPEPGKAAVPVTYTWSSIQNKGTYSGDAVLEYKDANGTIQTHKTNVQFKIN